jgi:carboxylesterase type B
VIALSIRIRRKNDKTAFRRPSRELTHPQPLRAGITCDEIDTADGLGSFHSSEYPYVFGTLDCLTRDWTEADRTLSDRLQLTWVAFADSGSPNGRACRAGRCSARARTPRCFSATGTARGRILNG